MTQSEQKSRKVRRDMARDVASQIAYVLSFQTRPNSKDLDHAIKTMFAVLNIYLSCNLDNPANFLRMIADVLDKKQLKGAKYDKAIYEAYLKAIDTGSRKDEREFPGRPLFSELYDKLAIVLTEKGHKRLPTRKTLRRLLAICSYRMSKKQGRHLKRKLPHADRRRNRGSKRSFRRFRVCRAGTDGTAPSRG
jgi:hypothetical protein